MGGIDFDVAIVFERKCLRGICQTALKEHSLCVLLVYAAIAFVATRWNRRTATRGENSKGPIECERDDLELRCEDCLRMLVSGEHVAQKFVNAGYVIT